MVLKSSFSWCGGILDNRKVLCYLEIVKVGPIFTD